MGREFTYEDDNQIDHDEEDEETEQGEDQDQDDDEDYSAMERSKMPTLTEIFKGRNIKYKCPYNFCNRTFKVPHTLAKHILDNHKANEAITKVSCSKQHIQDQKSSDLKMGKIADLATTSLDMHMAQTEEDADEGSNMKKRNRLLLAMPSALINHSGNSWSCNQELVRDLIEKIPSKDGERLQMISAGIFSKKRNKDAWIRVTMASEDQATTVKQWLKANPQPGVESDFLVTQETRVRIEILFALCKRLKHINRHTKSFLVVVMNELRPSISIKKSFQEDEKLFPFTKAMIKYGHLLKGKDDCLEAAYERAASVPDRKWKEKFIVLNDPVKKK